MKDYVCIVEALRFGDREMHSYVVGVYTNPNEARKAADAEEYWRGGKYVCEITSMEINNIDDNKIEYMDKFK